MGELVRLWVVPTGLRRLNPNATHTDIPTTELLRDGVPLIGLGIYGYVLSKQGQPVDVLADSSDDPGEVRTAVEALVSLGYVRVIQGPELQH